MVCGECRATVPCWSALSVQRLGVHPQRSWFNYAIQGFLGRVSVGMIFLNHWPSVIKQPPAPRPSLVVWVRKFQPCKQVLGSSGNQPLPEATQGPPKSQITNINSDVLESGWQVLKKTFLSTLLLRKLRGFRCSLSGTRDKDQISFCNKQCVFSVFFNLMMLPRSFAFFCLFFLPDIQHHNKKEKKKNLAI